MRKTTLLGALVLSASLLTGCGGSDTEAYCDDLESAKASFEALDSDTPDPDALNSMRDLVDDFAADAPEEVRDDWKVLDDAFSDLSSALEEIGLEFEDLGTLMSGQLPEGVTEADLTEAMPKLQETFESFDSDRFEKAGDAIEKHAKDECDIDLNAN